jgi:hypothetical protein
MRICGKTRRRSIEFCDQRPARIGPDGRNRSRARPHAEPVERQRCFGFCGTAHGNARTDTKLQRAEDEPSRTAFER